MEAWGAVSVLIDHKGVQFGLGVGVHSADRSGSSSPQLNTPCLRGYRFVHSGIVVLEQVWISYFQSREMKGESVILCLWERFREDGI